MDEVLFSGRELCTKRFVCLFHCSCSSFLRAIPLPVNENNPNLEKGEFRLIQQLVKNLPNGRKIKNEVRYLFVV